MSAYMSRISGAADLGRYQGMRPCRRPKRANESEVLNSFPIGPPVGGLWTKLCGPSWASIDDRCTERLFLGARPAAARWLSSAVQVLPVLGNLRLKQPLGLKRPRSAGDFHGTGEAPETLGPRRFSGLRHWPKLHLTCQAKGWKVRSTLPPSLQQS